MSPTDGPAAARPDAPARLPSRPARPAAGRRLTLRARLVLWQIAIFGAFLLASPVTYVLVARVLGRDLDGHVRNLARDTAAHYHEVTFPAAPPPHEPPSRCPVRMDPGTHQPRHVLVHDAAAGVLCSDGEPHALAPVAVAAAHASGAPVLGEVRLSAESLRLVAWPFVDAAGRRLVLESGASSYIIARPVRQALVVLLPAFFVALVLLIGGSYLLAHRAAAPINRIVRRVEQIDELRLDERLPPSRAASDELARLIVVINRMLERLQAAFDGQRRLASDVSHEIRSPLTALRGQIEVALRKEREPAEYRRVLEESLEEVVRLSRLAENLLSLARADAGVLEIQALRIDVAEVLTTAARRLRHEAADKQVHLEVDATTKVTVEGDPDWLGRVVENLLDNALRHTPARGSIRVELRRTEGEAVIAIADSGEGIPPDELPHIFERFYRVDRARSRAKGGAGLGLAIAHHIVALHRGHIEVRSTVGKGTTFQIFIPLAGTRRPDDAAGGR